MKIPSSNGRLACQCQRYDKDNAANAALFVHNLDLITKSEFCQNERVR